MIGGPIFSRTSVAVLSQAISSVTNFALVICLIAALEPQEFGLYSLAFACLLGGGAVFQGFFQLQLITQLPHLDAEKRTAFATALFTAQGIAGLIVMAIGIVVIQSIGATAHNTVFVLATCAALIGLTSKEFLIRYLFATNQNVGWVFAINLALAIGIGVCVLSGYAQQNAASAMVSYAFAHGVATVAGLCVAPVNFKRMQVISTVSSIAANGSWAAFSGLVYTLRANAHTFLVAGQLSLAQVGTMNAARTMMTPATLLIPTLSSVALPKLCQIGAAEGIMGVQRVARYIAIFMIAAVVLYSAALFFAWPLLQSRLLTNSFSDVGSFVALWAIYALAIGLRNVAEWAAQSLQAFQDLAKINILVSVAAVALIFVATKTFAVSGAIIAATLSEFLMFAIIVLRAGRTGNTVKAPA